MRRALLSSSRVSLLVWLAACDANLGTVAATLGAETGDPSGDTSGDGDGSDEPIACIGGELCPDGRACSNGVCLVECSGDGACTSAEYCVDGLCQPRVVPACQSDSDCAATQVCRNQVCTVPAGGACDPLDVLDDGCASNAICLEDLDSDTGEGVCTTMPACAADGTCPIGITGAVCNLDYLPNKAVICLIGFCEAPSHCPDQWNCVRYNNEVLGACSNGSLGSPCVLDSDCLSGACVIVPGLGGGFCA